MKPNGPCALAACTRKNQLPRLAPPLPTREHKAATLSTCSRGGRDRLIAESCNNSDAMTPWCCGRHCTAGTVLGDTALRSTTSTQAVGDAGWHAIDSEAANCVHPNASTVMVRWCSTPGLVPVVADSAYKQFARPGLLMTSCAGTCAAAARASCMVLMITSYEQMDCMVQSTMRPASTLFLIYVEISTTLWSRRRGGGEKMVVLLPSSAMEPLWGRSKSPPVAYSTRRLSASTDSIANRPVAAASRS